MPTLLLATCLLGASGSVQDAFPVPLPLASAVAWVSSHPTAIAQAAGSRVAWRKGDVFHVVRSTPRGAVEATMQDRILRGEDGSYTYECRLVPNQQSALKSYYLVCRLSAFGQERSWLVIRVQSQVDIPRVNDRQLQWSMRQSLGRVRELLQSMR